jgi:hypothetical protein
VLQHLCSMCEVLVPFPAKSWLGFCLFVYFFKNNMLSGMVAYKRLLGSTKEKGVASRQPKSKIFFGGG